MFRVHMEMSTGLSKSNMRLGSIVAEPVTVTKQGVANPWGPERKFERKWYIKSGRSDCEPQSPREGRSRGIQTQ